MPLSRTPAVPSTRLYRLSEVTQAETLSPGVYVIQRGVELVTITLREAVPVSELAGIVERVSSIQTARVA